MNWLDILLAAIILVSFVAGFAKGLARVGIGLAAAIIGVLAGLWFYGLAGGVFQPYVGSRAVTNFLGFLVVFGTVVLFGSLLGRLAAYLFKSVGLSWLDRLLGGAFGLLRGVLVAAALLMAIVAFSPGNPDRTVARSQVAPYVIGGARVIASLAPNEIRTGFASGYARLEKYWAELLKAAPQSLPRQEI